MRPQLNTNLLVLEVKEGTASILDRTVQLTRSEMRLLLLLRQGELLTPHDLLLGLCGDAPTVGLPSLRTFITRLRYKLKELSGGANLIQSVAGRGYKLRLDWARLDETAKRKAAATTITLPENERDLYDRGARLAKLGAWQCDLATEKLTWTGSTYSLFDLSPGAVLDRRKILDLYEDESRLELDRLRSDAIRHGGTFSTDIRISTALGKLRTLRLVASAETKGTSPAQLYGIKQDLSGPSFT